MKYVAAILILAGSATPAAAEVLSASPNGLDVRQTVNLVIKPEAAFAAFGVDVSLAVVAVMATMVGAAPPSTLSRVMRSISTAPRLSCLLNQRSW